MEREKKYINIKIPVEVMKSMNKEDIYRDIIDKAITKIEFYKSKCIIFEKKYKCNLINFKNKIEKTKKEDYAKWDDLIEWEAYDQGKKEWEQQRKAIECMV